MDFLIKLTPIKQKTSSKIESLSGGYDILLTSEGTIFKLGKNNSTIV